MALSYDDSTINIVVGIIIIIILHTDRRTDRCENITSSVVVTGVAVCCVSRYIECESPTSVHSEFVPRRGFDGHVTASTRQRRFSLLLFIITCFVELSTLDLT